jgi:hypothetical protein
MFRDLVFCVVVTSAALAVCAIGARAADSGFAPPAAAKQR